MRVFIFEHICGGGLAGQELTSRLVWEGGAMLRTVVKDFTAIGVDVVTSLDERVPLTLGDARVTPVKPGSDFGATFDRLAASADAALLVAPEFDQLLERWSARVTAMGVPLLGCAPRGVAAVADKLALGAHLLNQGVPTPATHAGPPRDDAPFPVVVKPRWGAGCERTFVCRNTKDVDKLPRHEDWITQPLVPGAAASAAFLVNDTTVRPLQAGQQFVVGKHQLYYHGGRMPLPPRLAERALALGERAVRTIDGLQGYVGVDLIMGDTREEDHVIEINPRLTVAYVGMRKLCKTSVAAAILDHAAPLAWHDGRVSYDASGQIAWEKAE